MSITHLPIARVLDACFREFENLPSLETFTEEELALYRKIVDTQDPLQWVELDSDNDVSFALWAKISSLTTQRDQSKSMVSDLLRIPAIMTEPPGGFI